MNEISAPNANNANAKTVLLNPNDGRGSKDDLHFPSISRFDIDCSSITIFCSRPDDNDRRILKNILNLSDMTSYIES